MFGKTINRWDTFWTTVFYICVIAWAAFTIFSLVWTIFTSFRTNQQLYAGVWALPESLHFENYSRAWNVVNLRRYFINSLLVTMGSITALIFICTPASYVLTRFDFRGQKLLNNLFIVGMGVPYQLLLIPLYTMMLDMRLHNSLFGLGLVYVALSVPFTVYLLSGFLRSLPSELEDSAMIDGCSEIQTFWKIMFPLAQPGIVTSAILNFIFLWNEYMMALVFISDLDRRTISLGLYSIQSAMQYTADWVGLFAAVVIVMLPTVVIYLFLSEKIMSGITLGAVKG